MTPSPVAGDPHGDPPDRLVQVIIVSYKTATLVENLLVSLSKERSPEAARGIALDVLVVDNASGDAEPLQRLVTESGWQDWVTIFAAPKNGGFAYGNNIGFRRGFGSVPAPDFFFLLNPDTEVRPGAIGALVGFLDAHADAGIVASSLEFQNGELWPYAFRFPNLLNELDHGLGLGIVSKLLSEYIVCKAVGQEPEAVDWFPGASMMIRRQVIEHVGGMDERYFLYYEETDFCRKVKRAGWTLWYVPESRVMHIAGESTGVTGQKARGRRLPDYWFESRRRYFVKNHGLRYAMAADLVFLAAYLIGRTKETLKGNTSAIPHFASDLLRHSALLKANRGFPVADEYKPQGARG